jgi:hypothetical protein
MVRKQSVDGGAGGIYTQDILGEPSNAEAIATRLSLCNLRMGPAALFLATQVRYENSSKAARFGVLPLNRSAGVI